MQKQLKKRKKKSKSITTGAVAMDAVNYVRCYETHPVIEFDNGEGKAPGFLAGGNCAYPIHKDYDVYIGLDSHMNFLHQKSYPWEPEKKSSVIEFQFRIPDGGIPANTQDALKMVTWICSQLKQGKKVHIGCIGGHGRTGMIMSAVLSEMCGTEDAISWIRKNYCKKAVESKAQVDWLHQHFGIKKVKGSKEGVVYSHVKYQGGSSQGDLLGGYAGYGKQHESYGGPSSKISPVDTPSNIWK